MCDQCMCCCSDKADWHDHTEMRPCCTTPRVRHTAPRFSWYCTGADTDWPSGPTLHPSNIDTCSQSSGTGRSICVKEIISLFWGGTLFLFFMTNLWRKTEEEFHVKYFEEHFLCYFVNTNVSCGTLPQSTIYCIGFQHGTFPQTKQCCVCYFLTFLSPMSSKSMKRAVRKHWHCEETFFLYMTD